MTIHLFNAKRVAQELGHKEIEPKARGYYLLASFLIFMVFYYSGLVSANQLWSWLSVYEAFVVAAITVVGFAKAYEASGGDANQDFITEFTCLYVPVSVTTILAVWPIYWAVVIGLREFMVALSESHIQFVVNLSRIDGDFFGLLTFLAAVLVQIVTFYRITKLFHVVRNPA